ncbi:MAG: radical SAM protein [Candidatus Abyssubacteria bacterium]
MNNRIALIDPPLSLHRRYSLLSGAGQLTPPIGLLYLASNCREKGFDVRLFDANALGLSPDLLVRQVAEARPRFVGLSANTLSISSAAYVVDQLKRLTPEIFTIVGGAHISSCPEETMERYRSFDAGVIGEGEETLVELMAAIRDGTDLGQVKGIIFRDDGALSKTQPRQYIKNLDDLPMPAWDLLPPLSCYKLSSTRLSRPPTASIITSRGCPGQCTFCDRSVFGQKWRGHGTEYVLDMIRENIRRQNIRSLVINDDTFVVDHKRLISICEGMIRDKLNLTWSCSARIDEMNLEVLRLMKRAGCFQIAYGLESGSDRILEAMRKRVSTGRMRQAIQDTKKAGIRSKGYFIIGYPGETFETVMETIHFALSVPLDDAQFTFLTPFPGTEVYRTAREKGNFTDDWDKMSMWEAVFVPNGFTADDMKRLRSTAFRRFYFRPGIIASYAALLARSPSLSLNLLKDFLSFSRFVIKK